ncbi:sigma factor [Peribacillus alkalitolerans]|uniref:sigma factor n=1 Tax=Peribacillus alkalitolerans TaxID=1550385 RepID=UPI001F0755DE|nr:sigma factor [Peribacillus alkalitolerans]
MRRDEGLHTLINQAISGNRDSFSQIYDLTIEEVTRAVYFLLTDRADLEDVIQETYIQAYHALSRFDSSRNFKPWLVGIAVNQVKKQRRKNFKLFMLSEKKKQFETTTFGEDASQVVLSTLENEELLTCIENSLSN